MVGRRVVAWRGSHISQHGKVIRMSSEDAKPSSSMDRSRFCLVLWDNGTITQYENAALTWESLVCKPTL